MVVIFALSTCKGAGGGSGFGRGGVTEDEEFDECAYEDDDRELPQEKALSEGETRRESTLSWQAQRVARLTKTASLTVQLAELHLQNTVSALFKFTHRIS